MRLRGFFTLTLVGLLLAPVAGLAQQPAETGAPITVSGEGTEVFRALLRHTGIKPVTEREALRLTQFDDVILITLGNPNTRQQPLGPAQYLQRARRGGVLIAADSFQQITSTEQNQLTIMGDRSCALMPLPSIVMRFPALTLSVQLEEYQAHASDLQGLNRIATNKPSYITVTGWGGDFQYALATFPPNCRSGDFGVPLERNAFFAVGGEGSDNDWNPSPYRFLVMADHSVFINQMLLEPGTQNLELTYRVIEFLQGPNKRNRCLFYEDGRLVDHFDDLGQAFAKQNQQPIPQINMGAMQEWLVTQGNQLIDSIQQDDVMNRAVTNAAGLPAVARFFLILATIFACWFVLRRAWGTRKPTDIPPAPAVAGAPSGPPGVFERRQKELLRRNNVYEPVRDLVREFFETFGLHGEQGPKHPKLLISDMVRKPDSLRAAIKDLWKLAYGPPQVLTVNRWRELEPYFERVRQAHADGKWRFVLSEATAGSVA